jgi:hypothetical protein
LRSCRPKPSPTLHYPGDPWWLRWTAEQTGQREQAKQAEEARRDAQMEEELQTAQAARAAQRQRMRAAWQRQRTSTHGESTHIPTQMAAGGRRARTWGRNPSSMAQPSTRLGASSAGASIPRGAASNNRGAAAPRQGTEESGDGGHPGGGAPLVQPRHEMGPEHSGRAERERPTPAATLAEHEGG